MHQLSSFFDCEAERYLFRTGSFRAEFTKVFKYLFEDFAVATDLNTHMNCFIFLKHLCIFYEKYFACF